MKGVAKVFLPRGIAHSFLALKENYGMFYSTTTEYNPNYNSEFLWNSFDCVESYFVCKRCKPCNISETITVCR